MTVDLNKRIVYQNDENGIAVIIPCDCGLSIDEIAAKDVPMGRRYKIVEAEDVPTDRSHRAGWSVDLSDLTDGVGA